MMSATLCVTFAMVASQFLEVSLNTLVKAANTNGMSNFIFVAYSNIWGFFILLLCTLLYHRKRPPPPIITTSILLRIFLLSCISTLAQTLVYTGIGFSSPTLSSAMVDLVPAFTFILATFSRMEDLNLKSHSGQAKIIGTGISIAGALIATLYKGMPLMISGALLGQNGTYLSAQSKWILGGFLLATSSFCLSLMFIVQTWVMKEYPEELIVTTICCGFAAILSAIIAFFAEGDRKAWILKPDMELVAVLFSAILVVPVRNVASAWGCHKKGPIFVAMFTPLGMIIAIGMGLIFLGDNLYLGSLLGAATVAIGFYAVMWAQSQQEKEKENNNNINNENNEISPSSAAPLLPKKRTDFT